MHVTASLQTQRRRPNLLSDERANTAVFFALALPMLAIAVGAAIDYGGAASARSRMQGIADGAAMASVQEIQLAQTDPSRIVAIAKGYVERALRDATTIVNVDVQAATVQVNIQKQYSLATGTLLFSGGIPLSVSATAKLSGAMPLCLLGLDPKSPDTITLEKSAQLTAPGCLVQSDSKSPAGLKSKDDAVLQAGLICSAGGKVQSKQANYSPAPTTDCPILPDPLGARTAPPVGACNFTNKVVDGASENLQPGVYCGGLTLTNGATATLSRGIYIMKDGPLWVVNGASIVGTEVGLYLTGANSNFTFDFDTTVNLSAPKDGLLAGILIFDDPTGTSAPAASPPSNRGGAGRGMKGGPKRQHQILSNNARNLLGTIYAPQAQIIIDADQPIADKSAYTVLVVKQLNLYSGPNLVLNTNYGATDVPAPRGVGPYSSKIFLTN